MYQWPNRWSVTTVCGFASIPEVWVVDNVLCLQACSFLLSNPDSVDYNGFYDACVTLLAAGTKVDRRKKDSLSLLVSSYSQVIRQLAV